VCLLSLPVETFYVRVGYTDRRPLVPDEAVRYVVVATDRGLTDAFLIAAQMVGGGVEMVTSTRLLWAEV
jgi:hypothetical protein